MSPLTRLKLSVSKPMSGRIPAWVEAYVWQDTSLGCPEPGQTYAPVAVDGYRIVLEVRDTQVIFHTDFDRAIPCDPDLEQLPES